MPVRRTRTWAAAARRTRGRALLARRAGTRPGAAAARPGWSPRPARSGRSARSPPRARTTAGGSGPSPWCRPGRGGWHRVVEPDPAGGAQRVREVTAGPVAVGRGLGQRLGHDLVDGGRQVGALGGQRRRGRGQLGPHHRQALLPPERRLAREHLVSGAGQRVLVGAAVDLAALDLLRRHVVERAQELPGRGDADLGERLLAEPEVGEVHVIRLAAPGHPAEQHVAWLHVPVDQAVGVGLVQRGGHLGDDVRGPDRGQRALAVQQRAHVLAADVAHRDVQVLLGVARVEDRHDVRMIDRGRGPHLPEEPLPERRVPGQLGGQDFQCHRPVQPGVERAVDDRHPPAADLLHDLVASYLRADRELACRRGWLAAHHASVGFSSPKGRTQYPLRRSAVKQTGGTATY